MTLMYAILIGLHALGALAAFGAGLVLLSPRRAEKRRWLAAVYAASLAVMAVAMLLSLAVLWDGISASQQLLYTLLAVLAVFILSRGFQAKAILQRRGDKWRSGYMNNVGFTLIALFDVFIIVCAIDLGLTAWLTALAAIAGTAVGVLALWRSKSKELAFKQAEN